MALTKGSKVRVGSAFTRLRVESLSSDAEGCAQLNGVTLHIPGAAIGDVLDVRVVHVSPHQPPQAWAEIERVRSRGDDFVMPVCAHAAPLRGRCGGCPLMHLSAAAQGLWKRALVQQAVPGVDVDVTFHPSPQPHRYRSRAHYVLARDEKGAPLLGSYAPRSHDVVGMLGCWVVRPPVDAVAQRIAGLLAPYPIHPEPQGVRYVTLRAAEDAKGCLVEWICTDLQAPWLPKLLEQTASLPQVLGVSASQNDSLGNALHVAPPALSRGAMQVIEPVGPLHIPLSTHAFFQLNTPVAAAMYARAAALIDPAEGRGVVWDLYCGVGALGLTVALAHQSEVLCGAEVNVASVEAARRLAAANGFGQDRARFAAIDLGASPLPSDWPRADVILVNPPRQGLDAPIRDLIKRADARQLVYMSCSPATLARDLADLCAAGWLPTHAEAHDMLPQTRHVEALVSLRR